MAPPIRQQNSVSALRAEGRARASRFSRLLVPALVTVTVAGAAIFLLVPNRQIRAWSAAASVIALFGAVIAWLARKSGTLSASDRDHTDFDKLTPPTAL